jgi:peroxidase
MREHNYWVATLRSQHPDWTGDQLYGMAKAITTAEYQNIVYSEYLPLLLGPEAPVDHGYNPNVSAQVTQEFSTAAFRMGHSEVSDTQDGFDNKGNQVFSESRWMNQTESTRSFAAFARTPPWQRMSTWCRRCAICSSRHW